MLKIQSANKYVFSDFNDFVVVQMAIRKDSEIDLAAPIFGLTYISTWLVVETIWLI